MIKINHDFLSYCWAGMPNRQTTSEELFATNNVKNAQELKNAIFQNLALIGENSDKLELVYNLTKSLVKK